MIKFVTIVGARPQIIKAAAISRIIRKSYTEDIHEIIIHTGQHYDANMSEVFFREMQIPAPDYNLEVGSASHARQTAMMMEKIEKVLLKETPDFVILFGDTNSTLAGSVTASKLFIPVVHIEAGIRSFNKKMPEEINRICCDHTSTLLFSPTLNGIKNLVSEGFKTSNIPPFTIDNPGVFHCGDVMFDNAVFYTPIAEKKSAILNGLVSGNEKYLLVTIHRDNNTDIPSRLNAIFSAINKISCQNNLKAIIPLHPRTSNILKKTLDKDLYHSIIQNKNMKIIEPVSFFDMIMLEKNSWMFLTDSGGVQKEAYFYAKPCIIMRSETEWVEIVEAGVGIIADANEDNIINAFEHFRAMEFHSLPSLFGDGNAADFICRTIIQNFNKTN